MSQGLNTPAEVVDILTQNSINKVTYPFMKTLLLGIMAGLMISFGADAALIAGHAIDNMSVGRVVSGAVENSPEMTRWAFEQIYCFVAPNIRPELLSEEGKAAV